MGWPYNLQAQYECSQNRRRHIKLYDAAHDRAFIWLKFLTDMFVDVLPFGYSFILEHPVHWIGLHMTKFRGGCVQILVPVTQEITYLSTALPRSSFVD